MSDHSQPAKSGGCVRRFLTLVILAMACGLGVVMFMITQPQDLSDIGGQDTATDGETARDLTAVLRASLERGHSLTLSEAEINRWLHQTLDARQRGLLASQISFERVLLRLDEGVAEIIMKRSVFGRPFTVSMFLKIEHMESSAGRRTVVHRHGGGYSPDFPKPMRGGRFGRLVVPQGFLVLVVPGFSSLADAYKEEIRLAFEEMASIHIESNRLVLKPREDIRAPDGFFK